MSKINTSRAYLIPGDEPVQAQTLKRLLLFFDHVLISDIKDEAIINEKEVIEKFPGASVSWSARGHYPRVKEYKERYFRCLQGAETALNRGLIQQVESRNIKTIDPGIHWVGYSASLSNLDLVKAAAIDASEQKPEIAVPNTICCGLEIAPHGMKSKYSIEYKESISLPNVHEDWNWISRLRVGRAIKSVRVAQALDAAPIAVDNINSRIVFELAKKTSPYIYPNDAIMDFVISTEIIDNEKLESILLDATWEDVLKIRKEILPHVCKAKQFLNKKTQQISNNGYSDIEEYLRALRELKAEFELLKKQEVDAWESLRIGSILKAGGAVGSGALGAIAMPSLCTLPNLIFGLVSMGLISVGALNDELQKLIPAKRNVREHPLFFLEKLDIH